ncbi:hypothetical protein HanPI659440_Chr12g0457631 [Helianthus annuus]|nr:hypothetical protein HanPI659440_Chr12g0457631 [Helianthus annuus]
MCKNGQLGLRTPDLRQDGFVSGSGFSTGSLTPPPSLSLLKMTRSGLVVVVVNVMLALSLSGHSPFQTRLKRKRG